MQLDALDMSVGKCASNGDGNGVCDGAGAHAGNGNGVVHKQQKLFDFGEQPCRPPSNDHTAHDTNIPVSTKKTKLAPSLRSPVWWFGGKGHIRKFILPFLDIPHHIYVEPFGGGASVLLGKSPAPVEVYNDLDSGLVNLFRILRDPEQFGEFHRLCQLTPYSREEYYHCRNTWQQETDPVRRAHAWFVVARHSFSGEFGRSWGFGVQNSARGMSGAVSRWLSIIDMLPDISARLLRVQIENNDFRKILTTYDTPETLFYCDPPYVSSTRRDGKYKHEMVDADHNDLVDALLNLSGMCVLSGYSAGQELYRPLEDAGWKRVDFDVTCSAVGRTRNTGLQGKGTFMAKQKRTESLWLCPKVKKHFDTVVTAGNAGNANNANNAQSQLII